MQSQQNLSELVIVETRSNQQERDQEQLYDRGVISILKNQGLSSLLTTRPPFKRSEKQCKTIADYLKGQTYFETIAKNNKLLLQISSWIEYRSVQSGEYIYHLHDATDCFYVLLSGQVHLTYPQKEVQEDKESNNEEDQFVQSLRQKKDQSFYPTAPQLVKNQSNALISPSNHTPRSLKRLTKHLSLYGNYQITIEVPKPKKLALQQRIVQMIAKGESFGDSLGDSTRRRTNAIAKEDSQLLVIKKQYFAIIANANSKSQGRIRYQFIAGLTLFKHVSRYSLESIVYLMEQVKINYNSILYSEQELIKYIYFPFKGEFKLYKKVKNSKDISKQFCIAQQKRIQMRNVSYKLLELGQILGLLQCHQKILNFQETCVCKSQEGVVLRIDKNKFMKKLFASENSTQQITSYLLQRIDKKASQMKMFLQKFEQSQLFVRYLNTPSGRSRRTKTESAVERIKSQEKGQLRRLSTASNNFFNQLNKTVNKEVRSTRISIKRSSNFFPVEKIPNRIKDIVGIVHQQSNYFDIRKPKENITLFEFNISKVPLHVKKKYQLLFKKQKV